ncbi:MAG: hypothetical protein AB8G99_07360 [Planctomycetaceae bacterium]
MHHSAKPIEHLTFSGVEFPVSRPHPFGIVIEPAGAPVDYLHDVLLSAENRDRFLDLIERELLVVCKNLMTEAPTYRRVRGKSSQGKLSQAEYYHHDGCSCPTKPRVVEIRLPHQQVGRNIHTAVARFPQVMKAMLTALPERLCSDPEIADYRSQFAGDESSFPPVQTWDKIQGRVLRLVRREMDAESCRAYYRTVDELANAYVQPWEMGESRLMINNASDLTRTTQHRRAYQTARTASGQNGSLVKRWTAEEAGVIAQSCSLRTDSRRPDA